MTETDIAMSHVRIWLYYPQIEQGIESWHKSLNRECIGRGTPLSLKVGLKLRGVV